VTCADPNRRRSPIKLSTCVDPGSRQTTDVDDYRVYHDTEWAARSTATTCLCERLCLEAFQPGMPEQALTADVCGRLLLQESLDRDPVVR
jgi:hypothetical protein